MSNITESATLAELVADIVGAYVSNNTVPVGELTGLIHQVHAALQRAASGSQEQAQEPPTPAVSVKKSVTPDYIICLEDGKRFKSLKRHLRTRYNMSPEEYRAKWNLPRDYPMVAPNYAASRSELARKMGLGQNRRGAGAQAGAAPAEAKAAARAPRGRRAAAKA
jgi:predicted transcriptional regulator